MSIAPMFARHIKPGDKVRHPIGKKWVQVIEVHTQKTEIGDRTGGWVEHESIPGARRGISFGAADNLIPIIRTSDR